MKKIPIKLDSCPIIESVFEIRFDSDIDREVVFPLVYSAIEKDFQPPQPLQVLQIPENIRSIDPNLQFQPSYRLVSIGDPNVSLQIGPRVIVFGFTRDYKGWEAFLSYVTKYLGVLEGTKVIRSVQRIGFRVINFFDWDIFRKGTDLKISLAGKELPLLDTSLRTVFEDGDYKSTVNVINNATLNRPLSVRVGSIIDIDTSTTHCDEFFSNFTRYMGKEHDVEKSLFFSLLSDELILKLKPTYQ